MVGKTVTAKGIGGLEALRIFADVLGPASISIDHPRFLSFVPAAPTEAAILFDLVVGASSIYGGSWLEGGGAVYAENEALRYIADLVGMPESAGGVFVTGGTAGNLSALIAARFRWRHRADGAHDRTRGLLLTGKGRALQRRLGGPGDGRRRRAGAGRRARSHVGRSAARDARRTVDRRPRPRVRDRGDRGHHQRRRDRRPRRRRPRCAPSSDVWLHVDGAYGGAGLAAPSVRDRYRGIEHADSFIVDPHKWLFAPFDCCALVYRDPDIGRAAHTQHAEYLDVLHGGDDDPAGQEWNPSDFAHHLSRRARGLPFWFSLATHGTEAYRDAIETALDVTRQGAPADRRRRPPRTDHGARAEHPAVPPHRVDRRRVPGVERPPARRGHGIRDADVVERRDGAAAVHHQPAHHGRRHPASSSTRWPEPMADLLDPQRAAAGDARRRSTRARRRMGGDRRRADQRGRRRRPTPHRPPTEVIDAGRLPGHARAWSTPTTTSSRTSPAPIRR